MCKFVVGSAWKEESLKPVILRTFSTTIVYLIFNRCGSVIVDLELSFTQSVTVDQVVKTLKEAARRDDFGDFKVDPESIGETGKALSPTGTHLQKCYG